MPFNRTLTVNDAAADVLKLVRTASANGDVVIGMRITNVTASAIKVSACITSSAVDYYLVGGPTVATMGADVPVGGSLVVINGDADKVVLNNGDTIKIKSSGAANSTHSIISVLEN